MDSLEKMKAEVKKNYQYEIGSSGALFMIILEKQHAANKAIIEAAAATIKTNQQPLQTDKPFTAFCYGLGKGINWALPLLATVCLVGWFYSQNNDYKSIKEVVAQFPNANKFKYLMQNGTLKYRSDGSLNLVLTPSPGKAEIQAGLHYVFDQNCNCVYVPLMFNEQ